MEKVDFVSKITLNWRYGPKAERAAERNQVFFDNIYDFSEICPEIHLDNVYHWLMRNFEQTQYKKIPSMKPIYDYAEEMDFLPEDKKRKKKKTPHWKKCRDCGKDYGFRGRSCPQCGKHSFMVMVSKTAIPSNVELIQEDCSTCNIYPTRNDDRTYVFGPECNSYGKGTKPFANCGDCACKICCHQYSLLIDKTKRYKDKMAVVRHEMPWIPGITQEKVNKKVVK